MQGRQVARKSLEGRTPHAGNQVYDEREGDDRQRQPSYAEVGHVAVVREFDFSEQIESQQREGHDPYGQIDLAVEQSPVVGLVGDRKELHAEGDFDEAQHDLHRVEPAAALRQFLEHRGEEGEDRKRQGECHRECEHRDDRTPEFARSRFDEHRTDDRSRAGERHQHERQGHEEDAGQAFRIGLGVGLVHHPRGHRDLESPEERSGEDHEYEEEEDVREPVRRQPVEDVGRHGVAAQNACDDDDGRDGERVERDDEESVHGGTEAAACGTSFALHEERNCHRNHREHAGGQQGCKAPEDGFDNQRPKRTASCGVLLRRDDLRGSCLGRAGGRIRGGFRRGVMWKIRLWKNNIA